MNTLHLEIIGISLFSSILFVVAVIAVVVILLYTKSYTKSTSSIEKVKKSNLDKTIEKLEKKAEKIKTHMEKFTLDAKAQRKLIYIKEDLVKLHAKKASKSK
jgi:uncharacterized membrane protein